MDFDRLISEISDEKVDVQKFAALVIENPAVRESVVSLLLTHPHIMVYYHCYYILDQATLERPDLFYLWWDNFVALLDHKNSYHRDFALTLLANLTLVDRNSKFDLVFESYFARLNDPKFMTAVNCVQNCQKIMQFQPYLSNRILPLLLDIDRLSRYPVQQKELLKSHVLQVLDYCMDKIEDHKAVLHFISSCTMSTSPKTKKLAKTLANKYGISS